MNLEPASGHFREVQHLIDEMSKVIRRCLDSFDRPNLT
jgi:hypothetical protein